jgi:hypothetical protein
VAVYGSLRYSLRRHPTWCTGFCGGRYGRVCFEDAREAFALENSSIGRGVSSSDNLSPFPAVYIVQSKVNFL